MKWLKRIGIGIVVVILLFVVIGFMLPAEWEVTRSREIKATPAQIHEYVGDWSKWPVWSPFEKEDPDMVITVDGAATGVGAVRSWKSEKMGDGSQTITASDPETGMSFDLEFGTAQLKGEFIYEKGSTPDTTKVTWHDWGENSGIAKWFGLMMEPMLGGMFEQGLADLETAVVEKK